MQSCALDFNFCSSVNGTLLYKVYSTVLYHFRIVKILTRAFLILAASPLILGSFTQTLLSSTSMTLSCTTKLAPTLAKLVPTTTVTSSRYPNVLVFRTTSVLQKTITPPAVTTTASSRNNYSDCHGRYNYHDH